MNFGQAIEQLKQGKKVARKGWNGKGMFIVYTEGMSSHFVKIGEDKYSKITTSLPYILMYTANKEYQPGWLASQADILSEDWEVCH